MTAVLIVSAVLALINVYLLTSVSQKLAGQKGLFQIVGALFVVFFVLQLVAPWLDWSRTPLEHAWSGGLYTFLVQNSYLALGVLSCLLVYMFVVDFVWLLLRWFAPPRILKIFGHVSLSFVVLATVGSVAFGLRDAGRVEVTEVDFPIKALPESFEGVKIAQISDIHIGPHLKRAFVEQLVALIADKAPDIVVLTGDLADGSVSKLTDDVAPLAEITAPLGKYYVTGNHEYYWGAAQWVEQVGKLGFRPLTNDAVTFDRDGASLTLAGVPDLTSLRMEGTEQTDIVQTAQKSAPLSTKILLSHQAKTVDAAKKEGFDGQISGHSHAGQYFPFTWIIKLVTPYTYGLYDLDGFSLYVNKGAGFWGPPLRTGGPGEITLLTLRRAE